MKIIQKIMKKVNIIKVIIVELYLVIAQLLWHLKDYVIDYMVSKTNTKLESTMIYYVFTIGIAIVLTIVLIALIITLKRYNKSKEEEQKNIQDVDLKNKSGEFIELVEILKDEEENEFIYVVDPKNISIQKLRNRQDDIETAYGIRIDYMEQKIPTRLVNIHCTPLDLLSPKMFQVVLNDNFLDDFISALVVGPTGSGKTYFGRQLVAKITWNKSINSKNADVQVFICDIKNEDFKQFKNCPNYYGVNAVDGIKKVHQILEDRMKCDESMDNKDTIILLVEEYGVLINLLDKTEAENVKKMIEDILFMGRSKKIIPILSLQRADAEYFRKGSREQFKKIILMGQISKTQADMLLDDEKKMQMSEVNTQGYGYLSEDGKRKLTRIKVAKMTDFDEKQINDIISSKMG